MILAVTLHTHRPFLQEVCPPPNPAHTRASINKSNPHCPASSSPLSRPLPQSSAPIEPHTRYMYLYTYISTCVYICRYVYIYTHRYTDISADVAICRCTHPPVRCPGTTPHKSPIGAALLFFFFFCPSSAPSDRPEASGVCRYTY